MDATVNIKNRNSIIDIWGDRTPYFEHWPIRVDEEITAEPDQWIQSACMLCSNGCGLDIGVKNGRIVGVRGKANDHVNHGRLGPKGLHAWEANHSADRLLRPKIKTRGKLKDASWEEAMNLIVHKTHVIRSKFTSSAIGFYTSGQLFLEEYYTLGVIGKAGLGTPHMDSNTRLCSASSAAALKLTFGSDGMPGSYADIDTTDTILHFGHNVASQQTVMWMRIMDRLAGSNPPRLIVIDPRETDTAKKADIHLAPRPGTNIALMNGLLNLIIRSGKIDQSFINLHTVGFENLKKIVEQWTPERVEEVTTIPIVKLMRTADILCYTRTLVSTVLQGVYQSMQATATAVQVNNIHLIRGLIGKKGCGIFQMNGQPSGQNTRECGANGDLPGFRNWENPEHIAELARLWNVDPKIIPSWVPPTHALQIFNYAEKGTIKMLWISATNPALTLPDISKIRKILRKEDLFLVVQDAFMNETAELADVVLPTAIWGEKTGCFTNVDRTVHISHKAIDPPGEARSDLDIFLDYAKRMDFRDKKGNPLIKWKTPEEAFEAWKDCSRGRPCDYSGLNYARLSRNSGIHWPCNERFPEGAERLYTDGKFNTQFSMCETFGNDMTTGAEISATEYKLNDPGGKAFLRAADYQAPLEMPDENYPLWLTTGRVVFHFHTRAKTGRSKALNNAAPEAFIQISEEDAAAFAISEGDMVHVKSRRGELSLPARVGDILSGVVFIPIHYGHNHSDASGHAANELTLNEWDPVSKQPHYKCAAVSIRKVEKASLKNVLTDIKDKITDIIKPEDD